MASGKVGKTVAMDEISNPQKAEVKPSPPLPKLTKLEEYAKKKKMK